MHRAPHAYGREVRTKIPSITELRLAHQCPPIPSQRRNLVQHRQAPGGRSQVLNAILRTVEAEDQRIRASHADLAGHVKNGLAEHIGRVAQFLAIEPDGREGIQALKNQVETLISLERRRRGRGKCEAIPPFALTYPGAGQFILVIKGVLNQRSNMTLFLFSSLLLCFNPPPFIPKSACLLRKEWRSFLQKYRWLIGCCHASNDTFAGLSL